MAAPALSTTRRTLLGAAAALPVAALSKTVRAEPVEALPSLAAKARWNELLIRHRRLTARAKAAAETGWFRAANDRYYLACATPGANRKAAFARVSRAEDLYWRRCTAPIQQAALTLIQTPSPDLEALLEKIATIRTHELHDPDDEERDSFKMLEADVGRLSSTL